MYRLLFFDPRMLIIWKISCAVSQMIYYGQITKCRAFCIEKWKILPSFWDCSAAMELLLMWRSIKPDIDVPHQIYLKPKLNSIKMYCFLLKFWIGENYDDGYFLHLTDMWDGMQSQCSVVALWQSVDLNLLVRSTEHPQLSLFRSGCGG